MKCDDRTLDDSKYLPEVVISIASTYVCATEAPWVAAIGLGEEQLPAKFSWQLSCP